MTSKSCSIHCCAIDFQNSSWLFPTSFSVSVFTLSFPVFGIFALIATEAFHLHFHVGLVSVMLTGYLFL